PGNASIDDHEPSNLYPSFGNPILGFTYPPTTYVEPSAVKLAAPERLYPGNTNELLHSVGPVSVDESSSSSLLQELNDVKAIAQAKNNNSQFFLFINYLNLVYNIRNFIFG